eukprot:m.177329 g.177329  ORF g.177329 m.177329 type:complete len:188 (+) comp25330_c1_seq3:234-797(+)
MFDLHTTDSSSSLAYNSSSDDLTRMNTQQQEYNHYYHTFDFEQQQQQQQVPHEQKPPVTTSLNAMVQTASFSLGGSSLLPRERRRCRISSANGRNLEVEVVPRQQHHDEFTVVGEDLIEMDPCDQERSHGWSRQEHDQSATPHTGHFFDNNDDDDDGGGGHDDVGGDNEPGGHEIGGVPQEANSFEA